MREAKLLERARALLRVDAERALAVLSEHEREFGRGALDLEREFLIISALSRLGRRAEAQARAEKFRSLAPGSLYEQRLERLLAGDAGSGPPAR